MRDLIESECGVRYHEAHVWRILRSLGWSCQRPSGRALERDEPAIAHWQRYRWPQLKKKPCARGAPSSSSTKRIERAALPGAYLGTARTDPGAAVPLQLEPALGRRRY